MPLVINFASNPPRPLAFRVRPATASDVQQIISITTATSLCKGLYLNKRRFTYRLDLLRRFLVKVITSSRNRHILVAEKEESDNGNGNSIIGFAQWRIPGPGGCLDDIWERFVEILTDGNEGGSGISPAEVTKTIKNSEVDHPVYRELANRLQANEQAWVPESERSQTLCKYRLCYCRHCHSALNRCYVLVLDFVTVSEAYRANGVGSKLVGWVYLKCTALDKKWVFTQAVGSSLGDLQSYRKWMFEGLWSGSNLMTVTGNDRLYICPLKRRMDGSNRIDYDLAVHLYNEENVDIDMWKWDLVERDEAKK